MSKNSPTSMLYATLVTTSLQGRYWQRIEQQRFAAVQRDQTLLAAEQPTPNAASLPLPITIELRYRKESLPLMQGVPIMIAMLLAPSHYGSAPRVMGWQMYRRKQTTHWRFGTVMPRCEAMTGAGSGVGSSQKGAKIC